MYCPEIYNTSWSNLKIYKFPFCSSVRPSLTKGLDRTGKRLKRTSDKQVEREESNIIHVFSMDLLVRGGILTKPPKNYFVKLYEAVSDCEISQRRNFEIFRMQYAIITVLEARNFAYLFEISFKRNFICFICNIMFLMT